MRIHRSVFQFSFILLAVLNCFNTVFAADISVLGPRQYVRTTGNPNIYPESFTAEPGEALLVIRNGEPGQKSNNDNRVTSGVVSLNGDVLFGHDDFKHQTYILETPITLQESNSLRIELESKPGTYIYLEIIQRVPDPVYDLMASDLQVETGNCPAYVDLNLRITNSGEDEIPAGVQVAFYNGNPEESGILIGTATSTSQLRPAATEKITYQWFNPTAEEAVLYARVDDDGTGSGVYQEVDETNNLIPVEATLCRISAGESSLSGHIIDAVNGNLLANVQTVLYADDNGAPGAIITRTESDSEGIFFIPDLAAGSYIIAASHSGYIDNQRSITLGENVQLTNQDLVLSPVLSADEIRIILTWNANPADLEAHLTEPNQNGCRYHCYYFNKTTPTASLDLDDRDGYGPETITITNKVTGTYRYYVHDFTNRNSNSRWLSLSGAEVKVYSGNREPLVFTVPYAYGNVWHVFDLDGETGEITPVQIMSRQSEPGRIDYPTITSGAPNKAYWGSPYIYQVRATDPDNDVLTYSLTQAPTGMTIDPETGVIEWTPSGAQSGSYYVTVKVEDGRCGEATQSFSVYVYSEPIAQFSASPCSGYNPGGTITLSWTTSRVTTVLIDQGIGEVEPSGSLAIPSPEVPTLYTLTAFNDAALVKRTTPAPPGASFYFSPYNITKGQSTTLYWNSQCSTSRNIDHGIGEVAVSGSQGITPTGSGYYYLNASNAGGSRNYYAYVNVYIPPDSFTINPSCNFSSGAPMTLSWHINDATDVFISPDVGAVEATGTYVVYPTEPGSYTLTATVNGNSITRSVSFPDLPSVSINPDYSYGMALGQTMTLRWWGYCADTVTIDQEVGEVPVSGTLSITPETLPLTYTVTATNERGSRSRSVQLYQRLPSVSLSPYPYYGMDLGGSVTLNWSTAYADTVTMNQGVGEIAPSGSMVATPDVLPKTYTVTATNTAGSTVRSVNLYQLPPSGSLAADPTILKVGNSTTLTWTSSRADSCSITPDIGPVDCNGSMLVTPASPTRYYFNMTGSGGTYSRSVYVSFVPPVADLKASPLTIKEGESTQLTWVYANATSCVINQGIGEVELGGQVTVSPTTTTTYTMTATGPGGTATDQVTIAVIPANPPPAISLSVSDSFIVRGEPTILSWESNYADSVVISPEVGTVPISGTATLTPEVSTTYTATATGPGGTTTAKVTVTVVQPSPTVSLTGDPITIMAGESATLSWTSSDADTIRFDQGIGSVPLQGSLTVSPIKTTTYTLTATGTGGTTTKSVIVAVTYPEPTVSFSATPFSVLPGETVTLTWATTDADNVAIEPGIGTVTPTGSITVIPTETTTYTITAIGLGGSATNTATVTVVYPAPNASLTIDPITITRGDAAQLTWNSEYADSCEIAPDVGPVVCNGSQTVTPVDSTTYTLTVTGQGGSITKTATLTVLVPPVISFRADRERVAAGTSVVLEWDVQNADTVIIEPNIGTVSAGGFIEVQILETTTYTLTATGRGGTSEVPLVITVVPPPQIDFAANPVDIDPGGSSILSWNVVDADSLIIDQGIGDVTTLSSFVVTPEDTTTYTLTVTGIGGTSTATVTVLVIYPPPVVSITVTPQLIQPNDSVTLSWSSTEADTVTIDHGIGEVPPTGTHLVNPAETSLYTIIASGRGGTAIGWVRVFVDAQGAGYSYGDPTPAEQAHLEAINRARANPEAEAERFGIDLYEGLAEGTINGVPRQPLVMNSKLLQASSLHSQDMIDHQFFAHVSPTDGRDPYTRMTDAGYQYRFAAENIGGQCPEGGVSAADAGLAIHRELFIDAGVEGRGHRLTLLNDRYKEIGIGMATGPYTGDPSCFMLTDDFAQALSETRSFVTGVVYDDANGDEQYTAGEGIGNAVLDVVAAGLQTTTASAGGYGIPLVAGTYTIIATLPGGFSVSKDVTIADRNVKVDFLYSEFNTLPPTVTFTGDVYTIAPNDSATLTWESSHGYAIEIDNGIGPVSASGSVVVSPAVTTTYTITVTGVEGTATQSVTITVADVPQPSVFFRASPELIPLGGSSTLSWNTFYADSCEIQPDIGTVPVDGNQVVTPATTTTYTLTCTGPGGTSQATVTVSYPVPTARITANPGAILSGQSVELSWLASDATSILIDNGIGDVAEIGSMQVTPTVTTTYTVTSSGPGGDATDTVTVDVLDQQALGVGITFPADGATLSLPYTMVQGIVTPGDAEVGLMVNGIPALRDANSFVVNAVPLYEGENTITIAATSGDGNTLTDSITVFVDTRQTAEWLTLSLIPQTGVAPFKTTLNAKLNSLERNITASTLTYDGPGSIAITQVSPDEYDLDIAAPGMYTLSFQATDSLNSSFQQDTMVYVYDREELSTLLQNKWNSMRSSLATGDINGALEVFSSNAKDTFSYNFNLLSSHLAEIAAGLQDITFINMYDGEAEFEMHGEQDGETYSFYVVFILDGDGIWRLRFF